MDVDGARSSSSSVDGESTTTYNSLTVEPSSGSSTKMDVSDHVTGSGVGGLIDDDVEVEESYSARNSDEEAEMGDVLGEMGLSEDQLKEIEQSKRAGMFVSAWEDDETGVDAKDLGDPREQFLTAAEEGQNDTIRLMLGINPEYVKAVDKDNYTPLHRAAYNDHVDTVRLLLQHGASPEARTSEGWTVLHSASAWGNFEVVGVLLSHGVDVNALSNGHLHALHLAVSSQEDPEKVFHTVRYLLQAPGVDAGVQSGAGDTPLALARRTSKRLFELLTNYFEKI
ncbi:hypothetical protein PRIPAC_70532 [Pristionchus pacificus]|uniref:Ankyrin repeat-containing protein n=1 Tax=Pristionchus pacificus TaxID=54126 RepID=A0A2A6C6L0_PRIPA|nr:hypothetical protein PRIPAC_70532 [Pristionchus pacificus]|eukprot:PDM73693.1 Ankyrin repeat-containing protein [Pristionchus pacificus]